MAPSVTAIGKTSGRQKKTYHMDSLKRLFSRIQWYALTVILLVMAQGCKPDETDHAHAGGPDGDTRPLVREAFARIDPMTLGVARTAERLQLLEKAILAEQDPGRRLTLQLRYGADLLKLGKTMESADLLTQALAFIDANQVEIAPAERLSLMATIAVAHLRRGEIDNCLQFHNHESCFIPIRRGGLHQLPEGSRQAIEWYTRILKEYPHDLESRYLLNLAYMTLGEYPEKVPAEYRIPPEWFRQEVQFPPFREIAGATGIDYFSLAGGVIIDDFTNDGWLDMVVTSWGLDEQLVFYVNNGDGSLSDQTAAHGLDGQTGVLHLNQTDINNDGWLDILLLRGAWFLGTNGEVPKTLLLNTGRGGFTDITLSAGLTKRAPSQAAAWADVDLDGWLDLVVANESTDQFPKGIDLYINQRDNTFRHASEAYGLTQNAFFKGCQFFDADNDKFPDLYLSANGAPNILLRNANGVGQARFIAPPGEPSVAQPLQSFPCFSFDFDNDGDEDLFVSGFNNDVSPATHWMQDHLGQVNTAILPKFYRNKGQFQFEEIGQQIGLDEVTFTMGCNIGDINVDGYLDFYLGTGNPLYQSLVPNKMYLNLDGRRFADVSYTGGFANIQKGHGVSFGDLDHDGDEDLYCSIGGAYEGDGFFNGLFENPNHEGNNWVVLNLAGTTANRPAIGARVTVTVLEGGKDRKIYRTVTSGASFGANSLALEIGLGKATEIREVVVSWPCRDCPDQRFTGLLVNKAYALTQGEATPKPLPYDAVKFKAAEGSTGHHH